MSNCSATASSKLSTPSSHARPTLCRLWCRPGSDPLDHCSFFESSHLDAISRPQILDLGLRRNPFRCAFFKFSRLDCDDVFILGSSSVPASSCPCPDQKAQKGSPHGFAISCKLSEIEEVYRWALPLKGVAYPAGRYYRPHSSFILMQVSCARLGVRGPMLGQLSVEGLSSRRPIRLLLFFSCSWIKWRSPSDLSRLADFQRSTCRRRCCVLGGSVLSCVYKSFTLASPVSFASQKLTLFPKSLLYLPFTLHESRSCVSRVGTESPRPPRPLLFSSFLFMG